MQSITLKISDEELLEVAQAYQVLQRFLDKIISPNELYSDEFLDGLSEARSQIQAKEFTEVSDLADFIR